MHWDYAIILAFLAVAIPFLGRRRIERILRSPATSQNERLRLYASTIAFQWLLVGVILWRSRAHGMTTRVLGLASPRPVTTLLVSVALVAIVLANQLISLHLVGLRPEEMQGKLAQVALRIFPQDALERLVFLGVVATVALCEELIYRGFVQCLFTRLFESGIAGVLISAAMFSGAHLYQGKRGLIATGVVGVLFAASRLITNSLIPSIAAHFVVDLVAGYFFPERLRHEMATGATQHCT